MRIYRLRGSIAIPAVAVAVFAVSAFGQAPKRYEKYEHGQLAPVLEEKDEKPQRTQKLETTAQPPPYLVADTTRLVFDIAPLSTEGLLSKQVREGLRALIRAHRKDRLVHLRAFVAGSGDTRRVQEVVAEEAGRRRKQLPTLTVVQVGKLARPEAQVLLELTTEAQDPVNPGGLALISGQTVSTGESVVQVAPVAAQSLDRIRTAATDLGLEPQRDIVRVTCYLSSIEDVEEVAREAKARFPAAALAYMQARRVYTPALVACEAVARLPEARGAALTIENPEALGATDGQSQVALLPAGPVLFTTSQLAFRNQEQDVRLAFERMGSTLEEGGASMNGVAFRRFYLLSGYIGEVIRKLEFDYFDKSRPPAATVVELEGLPALDASFAMEVVAVPERR